MGCKAVGEGPRYSIHSDRGRDRTMEGALVQLSENEMIKLELSSVFRETLAASRALSLMRLGQAQIQTEHRAEDVGYEPHALER